MPIRLTESHAWLTDRFIGGVVRRCWSWPSLLVPLIGWGVQRAILSNSNDVRDWLPAEYPETQQYSWFTEHFGVQDFIVASWPGCTLTDERLDQFVRGLSELAGRDDIVSAVFADSHGPIVAGPAGRAAFGTGSAALGGPAARVDCRSRWSADVRSDDVAQ